VDECSAFQSAMCDVVFFFEKDCFTVATKIGLLAALSVLDQFEALPIDGLFLVIGVLLSESPLRKSFYGIPSLLFTAHVMIWAGDAVLFLILELHISIHVS
jgi:hypothetical protein